MKITAMRASTICAACTLRCGMRAKVFACANRMGEKPLPVIARRALIFASDLKHSSCTNVFRSSSLRGHCLHYCYVPEPQALDQDVRKLPAGHISPSTSIV